MILCLQGGPHGREHFSVDREFSPPDRVLVQTEPKIVSVYKFASRQTHFRYVYQGRVEPHSLDGHSLDGLVEFVDFAK